MRRPSKLSPSQRQEVVTAYIGGEKRDAIAVRFGISPAYVGKIAHVAGLRRNPSYTAARWHSAPQPPAAPLRQAVVEPVPPEPPQKYLGSVWIKPSKSDLIIIHAREGLDARAICAQLGLDRPTVDEVLERARRFGFIRSGEEEVGSVVR